MGKKKNIDKRNFFCLSKKKNFSFQTIGRICQFHVTAATPFLEQLIGILLQGLEQPAKVANNCAWVIFFANRKKERQLFLFRQQHRHFITLRRPSSPTRNQQHPTSQRFSFPLFKSFYKQFKGKQVVHSFSFFSFE